LVFGREETEGGTERPKPDDLADELNEHTNKNPRKKSPAEEACPIFPSQKRKWEGKKRRE